MSTDLGAHLFDLLTERGTVTLQTSIAVSTLAPAERHLPKATLLPAATPSSDERHSQYRTCRSRQPCGFVLSATDNVSIIIIYEGLEQVTDHLEYSLEVVGDDVLDLHHTLSGGQIEKLYSLASHPPYVSNPVLRA